MPAPTSLNELLELIQKSGVVEDNRLTAYMDRLRQSGDVPGDPTRLADQMIRDGLITGFQAEQFLQGKWRRFNIGKYKVLERLGSGGMASVYLCEHKLMRRRVAVKVLPTTKAEDPAALERFYREARAVAALDHPNIVRAYDIDQDDKLHFLVMEHVDGANLQDIVKKTGPMEPSRVAHYMRQAALGLQHAHETAGLVHRDIKPGNVLIDRNGIVKILDMGLARFFHDEEDILTKKYDENVLGTADYLAPEQALDSHGVDIRADIYSLGATFYYCLTGRTPFAEGTVAQKLIWHQTRQPKAIRTIRPEAPEELVAVIERMMAKDPAHRYQTPIAVAEALASLTQTPIPAPPEEEMPQLSLAAMAAGATPVDPGFGSGTRVTANGETSPALRKQWQVGASANGGAVPAVAQSQAAPRPAPPVVTPVAPQAKGQPPAAAVPPVRSVAPPKPRSPAGGRSTAPPVVAPVVTSRKPPVLAKPARKPLGESSSSDAGLETVAPRGVGDTAPRSTRPSRPVPKGFAPPPPLPSRNLLWWSVGAGVALAALVALVIWWII